MGYLVPIRRAGNNTRETRSLPPLPKGFKDTYDPRPPYGPTYTQYDFEQHFTHRPSLETLTFFSYPLPREARSGGDALAGPIQLSPPHPLANLVSFICVKPDEHPFWKSNRELWTNHGVDTLLADWKTHRSNFGRPIPVFEFFSGRRGPGEEYAWKGWWTIKDIGFVGAHTEEVKKIIQRRNEYIDRSSRQTEEESKIWIRIVMELINNTDERFEHLNNIMAVKGGIDGQAERYILALGGLEDEIRLLDAVQNDRRAILERSWVDHAVRIKKRAIRERKWGTGPKEPSRPYVKKTDKVTRLGELLPAHPGEGDDEWSDEAWDDMGLEEDE